MNKLVNRFRVGFVLMLLVIGLCSCELVKSSSSVQGASSAELKTTLTDDFGVGFVIFLEIPADCPFYDEVKDLAEPNINDTAVSSDASINETKYYSDGNSIFSTSRNFESGRMYGYYQAIEDNVLYSRGNHEILSDVDSKLVNTIGEAGGSLFLSAKVRYTYKLIDCLAYSSMVMKNRETGTYYTTVINGNGLCSKRVSSKTSEESKISKTETINGKKKELSYVFKYEISYEMEDYLLGVQVLEMDVNNNCIKQSPLEGYSYQATEACSYVIIEETFKGYDEQNQVLGDSYVTRKIISRTDLISERRIDIPFPLDNGFINTTSIQFTFK